MSTQLFESALGIKAPRSVRSVDFDEAGKRLTILIDFDAGTRFAVNGHVASIRCTTRSPRPIDT